MRSYVLLLPLAALIMVTTSCGSSGDDKWINYTSNSGGYSVNMPASYTETERQEKTIFGMQAVHYVSWKPSTMSFVRFRLFQASYTNCPATASDSASIANILDSSIHMRIHDFTDYPIDVDQIELAGHMGRAFILDMGKDNTITICKECIANGKKYELTVIALKSFANEPRINQFFDSFRIQ